MVMDNVAQTTKAGTPRVNLRRNPNGDWTKYVDNPLDIGVSEDPQERQRRRLSAAEQRVRQWVLKNHGILTRIAKAEHIQLSVQFVQRVAYNREARSRDLVVERALLEAGCPLIQKNTLGL